MTRNPVFARVGQTASEAARLMHDLDVRHLPVVDERELVGIISDRDLGGFADEGAEFGQKSVAQVMSADVLSLCPEDTLSEAVDLIVDHKVGALPIVDSSGELVGILSYVDVLEAVRQKLAD